MDATIDRLIEKKETELVSLISLSDYCLVQKIEYIDLIKINAQVNYFQVFQGLFAMLKNKQIRFYMSKLSLLKYTKMKNYMLKLISI